MDFIAEVTSRPLTESEAKVLCTAVINQFKARLAEEEIDPSLCDPPNKAELIQEYLSMQLSADNPKHKRLINVLYRSHNSKNARQARLANAPPKVKEAPLSSARNSSRIVLTPFGPKVLGLGYGELAEQQTQHQAQQPTLFTLMAQQTHQPSTNQLSIPIDDISQLNDIRY